MTQLNRMYLVAVVALLIACTRPGLTALTPNGQCATMSTDDVQSVFGIKITPNNISTHADAGDGDYSTSVAPLEPVEDDFVSRYIELTIGETNITVSIGGVDVLTKELKVGRERIVGIRVQSPYARSPVVSLVAIGGSTADGVLIGRNGTGSGVHKDTPLDEKVKHVLGKSSSDIYWYGYGDTTENPKEKEIIMNYHQFIRPEFPVVHERNGPSQQWFYLMPPGSTVTGRKYLFITKFSELCALCKKEGEGRHVSIDLVGSEDRTLRDSIAAVDDLDQVMSHLPDYGYRTVDDWRCSGWRDGVYWEELGGRHSNCTRRCIEINCASSADADCDQPKACHRCGTTD